MKTSARAWRVHKLRIWAGLTVLLVLALAQFGLVFRFERADGQSLAQPGLVTEVQGLSDWFAGR